MDGSFRILCYPVFAWGCLSDPPNQMHPLPLRGTGAFLIVCQISQNHKIIDLSPKEMFPCIFLYCNTFNTIFSVFTLQSRCNRKKAGLRILGFKNANRVLSQFEVLTWFGILETKKRIEMQLVYAIPLITNISPLVYF